jgi:ubiquitin carboxyl-terminal hydrolase 36/42
MSLHKLPFILVIHLKRFSYHSSMGKINKSIKFEEKIELLPKDSPKKVNYYLYALLIHHGSSVHSGHYVAYVKVKIIIYIYI